MGHILKLAAAVLFFGASAVCAADGKVVANGYMVANGVRMTVESHGGGVGISARENYVTSSKAASFDEWRTLSFKVVPLEDGKMRIELFTIFPRSSEGREIPAAMLFDDFKINGENLYNGDFESGFLFWHSENRDRPQSAKPKLVFDRRLLEHGTACARVFNRTDQLAKTFNVKKNVPLEFSVRFRRVDFPVKDEDFCLDFSKHLTTDFVAATSPDSTNALFKKFDSKVGERMFKGVKFRIENPQEREGLSVATLASKNFRLFPNNVEINLSDKDVGGRYLYILSTSSDPSGNADFNVGEVVFKTADGQVSRPTYIQYGRNIGDCWKPEYLNYCRRGYLASKKKNTGALYITSIKLPPKALKSVRFTSYATRVWSIFGATISEKEIDFTDTFFNSPKDWEAADIPENYETVAGSALDFSSFIKTGIPAGIFGRAEISERGGICFSGKKEIDVRFKSFSLWDALEEIFKHEDNPLEAKKIVSRYAELIRINGYNLVRMHIDDVKNYTLKDKYESRMDLVDFLLSELKRNGVYVHLSLAAYDLGNDNFTKGSHDEEKIRTLLGDAQMRLAWRKDALRQLDRKNKYTSLAWKDDPVFLCFEIYNELCIAMGRVDSMSAQTKSFVRERWGKWLEKKYSGSLEKVREISRKFTFAPKNELASFADFSTDFRNPDWVRFLYENNEEFLAFAKDAVRGSGYNGILTAANMMKVPCGNAFRSRHNDMVIINSYFAHPWKSLANLPFENICDQSSSIETMALYFTSDASARLNDRPLCVTEYAHAYWNKYRYECGAVFPAYAALQNFSAITLHGNVVYVGRDGRKRVLTPFCSDISYVVRANEVLSAAFYLRGDVKPSPHRVDIVYEKDYIQKDDNATQAFNIEQSRAAFLTRLACDVSWEQKPAAVKKVKLPQADATMYPARCAELNSREWFQNIVSNGKTDFDMKEYAEMLRRKKILTPDNITDPSKNLFQSDTMQLVLDASAKTMKVATDSAEAAAIGGGGSVSLGDLKVLSTSVAACVGICPLDGKKISESSRMILVYNTEESNSGRPHTADNSIAFGSYGKPPIVIRKGELKAEFKGLSGKKYSLYPLAINGLRREKIELPFDGKTVRVDIKNYGYKFGATSLFEIVAE